jgi:tetratricopeptide (TPR) repeat protein
MRKPCRFTAPSGTNWAKPTALEIWATCIPRLSELPEARARYEEALPIYRAIGDKLGEANCIMGVGKVFGLEGKTDQALEHFFAAKEKYGSFGDAWSMANVDDNIGVMYRRQKNYPAALASFLDSIQGFPDEAKWYLNRASVYLSLEKDENALSDIEQAARLQPENAYLSLRRGQLSLLRGEYEQALAHFRAALERYPRMNEAYFGIGLAHLRAGRALQAHEAYQHGLSLTNSGAELNDTLEELAELRQSSPQLEGLEAIWNLLNEFLTDKRGGD